MKVNAGMVLSVITLLFCLACTPKLQQYFASENDVVAVAEQVSEEAATTRSKPVIRFSRIGPGRDPLDYVPDADHMEHTPWKYIRVNFHWVNSRDSSANFYGEEAIRFVEGLLASANKDLRENNKMWLPYRNETPVLSTRYQYRLAPRPGVEGDRGIYWHFDDDVCYYVHKGRNRNLMDREVIKRYGIQTDSVLNIFIMPHHPDSIRSKTYNAYGVGVSLGSVIKMSGPFEDKGPPWQYRGILNHEVGHVFGLAHTWAFNDGCDDTPRHRQNCWSRTKHSPCDTAASNNVMDYNALQNAWTPCQIGRVHMKMADEKSKVRQFLIPNWCSLQKGQDIFITDSVEWAGAKDLEGHLTIRAGGRLKVTCRLSIPEGGKITVEPGGELILDNARLHNACAHFWQGIEIQELGRLKGRVVRIGDVKVENAENEIVFE